MFKFSETFGLKQDLQELTISPYYQQKGEFNPYYVLKKNVDKEVKELYPNAKEIKYKCVEQGTGELLSALGRGKFVFQIEIDGLTVPHYVTSTASNVSAHFGMKTRKDSTASSNVNEFLTLYFMIHSGMDEDNAENWMMDLGAKTGDTGVLDGEGNAVTYDDLRTLIGQRGLAVVNVRDDCEITDVFELGHGPAWTCVRCLKCEKGSATTRWIRQGDRLAGQSSVGPFHDSKSARNTLLDC